MTTNTTRRRFQFSLRAFIALCTAAGVSIGLYWPRNGDPFSRCADKGLDSVWIGKPTKSEVIEKLSSKLAELNEYNMNFVVPTKRNIVTEKIWEDVSRCNFLNFNGRKYLHRVRYRCEVFPNPKPYVNVVYFEFDHYHMNGGGCRWVDGK